MKNILTVVKKEFARFFRDRRLVIGTLLLPAVLIFALYSLLGSVFYEEDEHYTARVVRPSALFAALAGAADVQQEEEAPVEHPPADKRAGLFEAVLLAPGSRRGVKQEKPDLARSGRC